jgi:hypothetical protein
VSTNDDDRTESRQAGSLRNPSSVIMSPELSGIGDRADFTRSSMSVVIALARAAKII